MQLRCGVSQGLSRSSKAPATLARVTWLEFPAMSLRALLLAASAVAAASAAPPADVIVRLKRGTAPILTALPARSRQAVHDALSAHAATRDSHGLSFFMTWTTATRRQPATKIKSAITWGKIHHIGTTTLLNRRQQNSGLQDRKNLKTRNCVNI